MLVARLREAKEGRVVLVLDGDVVCTAPQQLRHLVTRGLVPCPVAVERALEPQLAVGNLDQRLVTHMDTGLSPLAHGHGHGTWTWTWGSNGNGTWDMDMDMDMGVTWTTWTWDMDNMDMGHGHGGWPL
jgi:hypothetical protein